MPWVQRPRPGIPSYETNFAGPDRLPPANPNLWDGLEFSWHGPLGVTGIGTDSMRDTARGHLGTPQGSMTADDWVMSEKGYALETVGDDQGFLVPDSASLDLTGKMTLAAWIYPKSVTGFQAIITKGDFTTAGNYALWLTTANIRVYRNTSFQTANNAVTINTWVHVAVVLDGTNVNYYVDGSPFSTPDTLASAGDINASQLAIGRQATTTGGGPYGFTGLIGSANAWDRALAPNEIQTLFQDTHAIPRPMQRLFVGGGAAAPSFAGSNQIIGGGILCG